MSRVKCAGLGPPSHLLPIPAVRQTMDTIRAAQGGTISPIEAGLHHPLTMSPLTIPAPVRLTQPSLTIPTVLSGTRVTSSCGRWTSTEDYPFTGVRHCNTTCKPTVTGLGTLVSFGPCLPQAATILGGRLGVFGGALRH